MEEEDMDMHSSPYDNYLRLISVIQLIESGARVTEDWVEEHKQHILKYRDAFPNFRKVNEEMDDSDFRRKADETEVILSNLVHEVITRKTFTVKLYLLLNKRMKELCEIIWGEDELSDMLGRMGM
jgi:hypothetical protein